MTVRPPGAAAYILCLHVAPEIHNMALWLLFIHLRKFPEPSHPCRVESNSENAATAQWYRVRACHVAAPGSIPVVHGGGLWRFISRPTTVETVYLSWLARSRKWRCRLTDIEWNVKEPLRATSSLAVTTVSDPTSKIYISQCPYIKNIYSLGVVAQ